MTNFSSSVTQARISNTVHATDPCALILSNTPRAYQVTVRAIAFTHTFYAYMNLSHCWMNSTFKMIDSALGLFMEVIDNSLSFPEHFESSQLDICSSRYSQNPERCSDTDQGHAPCRDPCALIFSHTIRAKDPCTFDFAHTVRADLNTARIGEFSP